MQQIQFNKTWSNRVPNPIVYFFENLYYFSRRWNATHTKTSTFGTYKIHFGYDGLIYYKPVPEYMNVRFDWTIANHIPLQCYLTSKEGLDELDNLNKLFFNSTEDNIESILNSKYDGIIAKTLCTTCRSTFRFLKGFGATKPLRFQSFIRRWIPGKENVVFQGFTINLNDIEINIDVPNNTVNFKAVKPMKLEERFIKSEYDAGGNTDLYIVIPYRNPDGVQMGSSYNKSLNKSQYLLSYIALKVTDLDGDGDIKFDHLDFIDYIDSFEFTLKTPPSI